MLREKAVKELYDHIKADDRFTKCISIGPVREQRMHFILCNVILTLLIHISGFIVCSFSVHVLSELFILKYYSVYKTVLSDFENDQYVGTLVCGWTHITRLSGACEKDS